MAKTGRPTKLTPEVQDIIIKAVARGAPDIVACEFAGIHRDTLIEWKKRGAAGEQPYCDFLGMYRKAKAARCLHALAVIERAAEESWQAAAWYLERTYPDHFGRKQRLEHWGGDEPIKIRAETQIDPKVIAEAAKIYGELCHDSDHENKEGDGA